ncbi:acyl carrier protein [Phyllobacterium sp. YR531]|uniref:acyl carrier protein n=1 Tax=Phyllobacterium sp. YR531 TaxID=1144343 RepID=UPI00026F8FFE|nr:acyl carrier protein [Phyllobacterium sp. YR531]EJN02157.1 acyl carrier protein [Phyllobacterium sp. YR531]
MTSDLKTQIRTFIVENYLFGDASHPLDDKTSLIETDIIDSTGVLELVTYLEDTFEISVQDSEIVPANLDSIASIASYVASKTVLQRSVA